MEIPEGSIIPEKAGAAKTPFWGFWATTGFGLLVIVASFIAQGLAILVFLLNYLSSHRSAGLSAAMNYVESNLGTITTAALILEVVICIPLIAAFVRLRRSLSFKDYLGLRGFKVKTLLFWLGVNFVYLAVSEGIRYAFKIPQGQSDVALYSTTRYLPLFFVAIVVFAPAFEEVLFRGFMFQGYSSSRIGPVFAIIITAAWWASLHVSAGAYDLAVIFASGLVLGLARWKTGSLLLTFAMHAFWNVLAFITLAAATTA
ncbi:MAG: CPBP family intramembrane metalloprotease [Dehalococcoidales bacterium]|nr:CPBP family intramembrane metalloprotease [Dehalococcoidales bacterium]